MRQTELAALLRRAHEAEETVRDLTAAGETAEQLALPGLDLRGAHFTACRFVDCDFSRAGFVDVTFERCAFETCRFCEAYFRRVRFDGCKADGANFAAARLHEMALADSSFRYANFTGQRLAARGGARLRAARGGAL